MAITSRVFGKNAEGADVTLYTMTNHLGASVSMIDYGATIQSIIVPDREGNMADIVTGFDTMAGYLVSHGHMGETIGRYGNRIGNAEFTIDGVNYPVAANNGKNHLHGGKVGFGVRMWETTTIEADEQDTLAFHLISPDGEENYPGTLDVTVTYTWDDDNNLSIRYRATTDKATLCNMTNHAYFNLGGHDHGTIGDHVMYIDADAITKVDDGLIPTGEMYPVTGTPLDLRDGMMLEDGLADTETNTQMKYCGGYDLNYVLAKGTAFATAAVVVHEASGRTMEVLTDQPGVQFYTANTTDCKGGKGGFDYGPHCAFCLETQHFPDSPHNPQWATTILRPGEVYDTTTVYAFRVEEGYDE